jgi:hypothetical protein
MSRLGLDGKSRASRRIGERGPPEYGWLYGGRPPGGYCLGPRESLNDVGAREDWAGTSGTGAA